ncbi:Calx-beta domain-containing protein [Archangium primigenium]|uniref:Calx-beta domain-containing protein n=1 Tax=[Archangium] primigenium TaxID=2792470 RepID=UPI001959D4E0|nr:Calx-beta domain-containing protein [Archangium primigenium]MBM7117349.1 hypothetical protein [Archangium primigenium]
MTALLRLPVVCLLGLLVTCPLLACTGGTDVAPPPPPPTDPEVGLTPRFVVSAVEGAPSEAGTQARFTVTLSDAPRSPVSVDLSSDRPEEGRVSPAGLTFTPDDWSTPRQVLVTGVDDALADGPQAFSIRFEPSQSDDVRFSGLGLPPLSLINADDDTAGIVLTEASGATSEDGTRATFTVVLTSQPRADVLLGLESSAPGEGRVEPRELRFTPDAWRVPQVVTVTGVDDDMADGPQGYAIVVQPARSEDPDYAGWTLSPVAFVNTDNDTVGLSLTPRSGETTEAGGQTPLTLVLDSRPTAAVTVHARSSHPGEGRVLPESLTFTPEDWRSPRTLVVTGVDDARADGDQPYTLTLTLTSDDATYAALPPAPVAMINRDDDTAGFSVGAVSGFTNEAGEQATFTVVLTSEPLAPVTLPLQSDDTTEGTLAVSELTFTPSNWFLPQTVVVTGVDDALADGVQLYTLTLGPSSSADPAYAGREPAPLTVSNRDNDVASITVSAVSGFTTEAGGQATFTVVLTSEPRAPVTLPLQSDDTTEGTLAVSELTFTPTDWATPQTVVVTGVDDALADADQPYLITFGLSASADPAYAGHRPGALRVFNRDNDTAGVQTGPVSGPTSEAGGQATFTLALTSEPTAPVTLRLQSNDTTEGTLPVTDFTFTPANWMTPQTVVITGVDDTLRDGDVAYRIIFSSVTSADPVYAALQPVSVPVTNLDNDTPGLHITSTGGPTEAGGKATVSISLAARPYTDVFLFVRSSNKAEATVSASPLEFSTTNWNVVQNVFIQGVDDLVADGDQPVSITFLVSTADSGYAALTPPPLNFVNLDNDVAGILVSAVSGTPTEKGGKASFTVTLRSQPRADVTIALSSTDETEGVLSRSSLVFTSSSWRFPQRVEVTGQDDEFADGSPPYAIVFAPSTSTDSVYAGLVPESLALGTTDDDTAGVLVSAPSGHTLETGASATFTVALTSRPFAPVTYTLDSSDPGEGVVSPSSFTITPDTWRLPRTVTVTGVDDALADGDQGYQVLFQAPSTPDATYAALPLAPVALVNQDDDSPGIFVTPLRATTHEDGGHAVLSARLLTPPTAPVTLHFDTSDPSEGVPDATHLTFTPTDWNQPRPIVVKGVRDLLADGDQPYQLLFSETTSGDPAYAGRVPPPVALSNRDATQTPAAWTSTFDSGLEGWSVTGTSATVGWNADNTPTSVPGGAVHAGARSLNYNNGVDYNDGADHSGSATSPVVHVGGVTAPQLTFWCNYQTEEEGTSYDQRFVRIHRREGAESVLVQQAQLSAHPSAAGACEAMGTWHTHTLDLDPAWGPVQVRFTFLTADGQFNNYAGWFVDDVTLRLKP